MATLSRGASQRSGARAETATTTAEPQGIAVITGAGSGIGRALSLTLAARGLRVVGVGRREAALQQTRELVGARGCSVDVVVADVSHEDGRDIVAARVHELVSAGARLVCLVHNAAVLGEICPATEATAPAFRSAMAANVEGPLFLTQALAGVLDGGRVLHVSSGAAGRPVHGWLTYCTSKAALYQLMRCLDLELQPKIRVGSARPGVVDTEMQDAIRGCEFEDVDRFRKLKKEGGLGSPEDVAEFFAWLLLDVPADEFGGREWDINDAQDRQAWLAAAGRSGPSSRL